MEDTQSKGGVEIGKLMFGLALVAFGVIFFLDRLDLWDFGTLFRKGWPLIMVFFGLSSEIDALRHRRSDGGHFLIGVGTWLFIGINDFFGLSVATAFPIGIIVVGLGVVIHALVDRPQIAKEGSREDE
jgi:hypothetical protein